MFTFTMKLTDIPNIQDDEITLHKLKQKKSVSDFSIWKKKERILSDLKYN